MGDPVDLTTRVSPAGGEQLMPGIRGLLARTIAARLAVSQFDEVPQDDSIEIVPGQTFRIGWHIEYTDTIPATPVPGDHTAFIRWQGITLYRSADDGNPATTSLRILLFSI